MLQIRPLPGLNEDGCSNADNEQKVIVEAEETIAISEYLRALNIKIIDQDCALGIFLELLDSAIFAKVSNEGTENKLFSVKYNCYRNAGLIYREKGQNGLAIEYFIHAAELDDTDVQTIFYLAKLAFKVEQLPIANMYFEKCIKRNPHHWPSLHGLLQVFCLSENIMGAFLMAKHCYEKDSQYKYCIGVLSEIFSRFNSNISFLGELFGYCLKLNKYIFKQVMQHRSSFIKNSCLDIKSLPSEMNHKIHKIYKIDWTSIGDLIIQISTNNSNENLVMFSFEKILGAGVVANLIQYCQKENKQLIDNPHLMQKIYVSKNSESGLDSDARHRRRDSELKILEQWGWHKNRRSSRKKSLYDITVSANGFLRRAFSNYFITSFNDEMSPIFGSNGLRKETKIDCSNCNSMLFVKTSHGTVLKLLQEFQHIGFDSFKIAQYFVHFLSDHWNEIMPWELCTYYMRLCELILTYENCQMWNQLDDIAITDIIGMALFYIELKFDRLKTNYDESELDRMTRKVLNHIQLYACFLSSELYTLYQSRYLWLCYNISISENNLCVALSQLQQIEALFLQDSYRCHVHLPNLRYNNFYSLSSVQDAITTLKLKINLDYIENLYDEQNYETIVCILKDSLICETELQMFDENQYLHVSAQIEILLESMWNLKNFVECMDWAEKALKFAADIFVAHQNDMCFQIIWSKTINFIFDYIEGIFQMDVPVQIEYISRLVQSLHKILTFQLDAQIDKHLHQQYTVDCWKAWLILYLILERKDEHSTTYPKKLNVTSDTRSNEKDPESMCSSVMLFCVAHELLGRRRWCSKGNSHFLLMMLDVIAPKLRSPMIEPYRDMINECLEQTTFCLYGYPTYKKGRMRHIQDHYATPVKLTWRKGIQLFDIFRPDILPEFNSFRIDSISTDMEALLQLILSIMPEICKLAQFMEPIISFIDGIEHVLDHSTKWKELLCPKIKTIFYLLGDYYFKSRDFTKAITYYVMDIVIEPARFDSWAGISLSKASKCETILNSTEILRADVFLRDTNNVMKCFEQCLQWSENVFQILVEYGTFSYNIHSYCSRYLKFVNSGRDIDRFSYDYINSQCRYYLNIASTCFNKVNCERFDLDAKDYLNQENTTTHDDEKWLYHYMLGKISEKKKEQPILYLKHYLKSARLLYECNATYPIKINHSSPSRLSVEALEIFYRTNAAIIKYTEQNMITKQTAALFKKILKELANSPFAINRAKIYEGTFKRKLENIVDNAPNADSKQKPKKIGNFIEKENVDKDSLRISKDSRIIIEINQNTNHSIVDFIDNHGNSTFGCSISRNSQDSTAHTNTTISSATSTISTDSDTQNSSRDISSDSNTDTTSDDEPFVGYEDRETIFMDCIKNLEECITRFPEHYKSFYRLAFHYLNAPGTTKSVERCRELLLGSYQTALGNQIAGLYTERRNSNIFNGIWRIPSADIDRPGSFASHLFKCTIVLLDTLKLSNDREALFELAIHLYRHPEADKKYLNESDRKELLEKALLFCAQEFRSYFMHSADKQDDIKMLSTLLEMFTAYRKCVKMMHAKESIFSDILMESYKLYIKNKIKLPENANLLDLAIKLCSNEINYRKMSVKLSSVPKIDESSRGTRLWEENTTIHRDNR